MKKYILLILLGTLCWTGCQKETFVETEEKATTWTLTVNAQRNDAPATKGLEIGEGTEASTSLLKSVWKTGEEVKVYLGAECIGTLTATPDALDAHQATLSGEITTTGIVANSTVLTLLTPRESWDYTGQVGKLLLTDDENDSIEKKYHYTMASPVLVTAVSGNGITTETAHFSNQQSIYRLSFRYNTVHLSAKSVSISSENGHLVQSQTMDGTVTEGPISVTLGTATADPLFVALRNGDEVQAEKLYFTVVDAAGVSYRGSKNIPAEYKANGSFVSIKNASLTERMDVPVSSIGAVSTAL